MRHRGRASRFRIARKQFDRAWTRGIQRVKQLDSATFCERNGASRRFQSQYRGLAPIRSLNSETTRIAVFRQKVALSN